MDEVYSQICWKIDDDQNALLQRFISGLGDTVTVEKDSGDTVATTSSYVKQNDSLESSAVDPSSSTATTGDVDYSALLNREFTADASYVVSPVEFYLQPTFWTDEIDRLDQDMTDYYLIHNKELSTAVPFDRMAYENMPCAVAYDSDGTYYRARVTHVGSEDCKIVFSDWGNGQFAKFSDMRPLMKQFAVVPPLSLRCRLDGVVERTLLRSVIDKFNARISENLSKRFLCVIKRVENKVFYVDLFDRETKTNIGLEYMPVDDMVPGFTCRSSIADKMNKKDTESATPKSSSKKSKKRLSSSDSTSTDSDSVVCYDSDTALFTPFSGEILAPIRPVQVVENEKTNNQGDEKSKNNEEFKNVEGWPSVEQSTAPMKEQSMASALVDSGTSASPPPPPSMSKASTSKTVVDSSTSPKRPSTPIAMIFKVKAPAPPVMCEAATEPEQSTYSSRNSESSDSTAAAATSTNVASPSSSLPTNNQVQTILARQEPIFEEFRPVLLDAEQYYRSVTNLEEKIERYRRGEYANTLEAFLDGVPVADDEDEFADSSEEEAAEQRRKERKKKKTLKQLKRELEMNQRR